VTDSLASAQPAVMPGLAENLEEPPSVTHGLDFDRLYAAEFVWVHRTLRRLGARERDLDDLAHDVFVGAFRALDRFEVGRPIRPWLFGIAFRVVSDYRRRARFSRESLVDDQEPLYDADQATPESELARARDRALVLAGLDALPLDQRAVFVAHELDGTSIPELADGLGLSINTLYSRLRLARAKFALAVTALRERGPAGDRRSNP